MKADKHKIRLAMARACMRGSDIASKAMMPQPTVANVLKGRSVTPITLGKVARALGVDVAEITEEAKQ